MLEVAPEIFALLIAAAFAAGVIDAIAGGGGLITVPVLLIAGAPPATALATNKLQAVFGSGGAAYAYARGGHVDLWAQRYDALLAAFGAAIGAGLALTLSPDLLMKVLPVLLIAVALYFGLKPSIGAVEAEPRFPPWLFTALIPPVIGFYDGILGPGTGSFFMLAFVALGGYGILRATAHTKLLNFASNFGALVIFVIFGTPWWITGLAMGAAQWIGAQVGARLAMRVGGRIIRPLLVVTSLALALKLLL
ncbi:TSUP family transporter [Paracoccaceae bacterium GXU_MW_L88]